MLPHHGLTPSIGGAQTSALQAWPNPDVEVKAGLEKPPGGRAMRNFSTSSSEEGLLSLPAARA